MVTIRCSLSSGTRWCHLYCCTMSKSTENCFDIYIQWRIQGGGQEAMASPFGIKHASGPFGSLECSEVPKGAMGALRGALVT